MEIAGKPYEFKWIIGRWEPCEPKIGAKAIHPHFIIHLEKI